MGVSSVSISNGGRMGFIKQDGDEPKKTKKAKKPAQPQAKTETKVVLTGPDSEPHVRTPSIQHDINHVAGLGGIEQSLDVLAEVMGSPKSLNVFTGYDSTLRLTLAENDYDDTMGRVVTAFERIADSVAKLAGLSRPRLESWHEQEDYEPRYKSTAGDGGAPGPKTDAPKG
jgi:hypothetical protein